MFFLLLFLFAFPTHIYADDFNVAGDSSSNWFFQATAFTVEKFPSQEEIEYDTDQILGEDTSNIFANESLNTLTDFGNMRRIPNYADRVYGPPGTKVDVLYFYKNDTGHSINIQEIVLPLSRKIVSNGNISKNLLIEGSLENLQMRFLFSGQNLDRDGIYKRYSGVGNIANGFVGKYRLDQWYIKDPLIIKILQAKKIEAGVNMKVIIKNDSDEYFNNLQFKHLDYENTFNLGSQEDKLLEYGLNINEDLVIEGFTIYNPNIKTRCAIEGGSWYEWLKTDSITVFAQRENDKWIGGGYVQPVVDSMCIKRIAYTIKSENIEMREETPKEENGSISAVLGINSKLVKLPQTSKNNILGLSLFVVIDSFLWYAFLRRRENYESKNNNSRLCTKSSEDALKRGL